MQLGLFWQIVGWFSLPVLVFLAVLLIRKGASRLYPYFFNYILASLLIGLIRLSFSRAPLLTYFYVYWLSDAVETIFAFLATYELFLKRLFPGFHKIGFYRYLFPAVALVGAALAGTLLIHSRHVTALATTIRIFEVVQVVTLLFFALLMVVMGRFWSRYEFGIGFGLAIEASAALASSAMWVKTATRRGSFIAQLPVIGYDLACIIWVLAFLKQEPSSAISSKLADLALVEQAKQSEDALKEWLSRSKQAHK